MSEDYYKTLEVSKTASNDEIQKAYRKLARKHHPDLNQNDPKGAREKFQKVQEAFEILGNPEKRKFYDQFGVSPDKMGSGGGQGDSQWSFGGGAPGGGPFRGGGGGGGGFNFENIDDILKMFGGGAGAYGSGRNGGPSMDDFFRAGAGPARPVKGSDLERSITIPFTMSVEGGKVDLAFRRSDGKHETVSVKIPPGIVSGKKIRLTGLGNPGQNGGKPGNLLVIVNVEEHSFFTRKGDNLYVRVPVTLKEAVFGGKIDIPTPKGNVTLTVPAGSSSGTKLRVRGCGVPKKDGAGDLFAELSVTLPKNWSEDDKKLLEKLATAPEKSVRNEIRWR